MTEILKKADKANVYTKTEMDTQQSAQDTKIDKNTTDVAKNTSDITKYTADVAKNTSDIAQNTADIAKNTADIEAMPPYVDAYTKTETNTLLDGKANAGDSYLKAETYTKTEVDAIAGSGGGSTPTPESWAPHDYLYVKNTDPDNIIPPLPGQVYFAGEGAPLADENYSSLRMMIISKFDQEGREILFPDSWYGNQNPEVNISSANGKGRFYAESLTSSDDWDPLGGEETYYMIYLSNPLDTTYNTLTEGTLSEGDTVQIETSEEGYGVDWIAKDIKSPEHTDNELHPPVTIPYAEVKYKNINLNGLFIGMTTEKGAYDNTAANIIIGEKPHADTTVNGEYIPGIYWNPYTVRGNIAIGSGMLPSAKAANDNLIIGNYSLGQLVEGDFNTSIGNYAGWGMTSGENNIFIGNSAEPKLELAKEDGEIKNQVVLGNEGMEALFLGKHQIFPFPDDLGGGVAEPWQPHDYLFVNNWTDTFVAPKPGEVFFSNVGGSPVTDNSYESIKLIYISKYDKEGNELPFDSENIYNEETGELEWIIFHTMGKEIRFESPNGFASFYISQVLSSDIAPEHVGYEGETFYIIQVDADNFDYAARGTVDEGEVLQVTSPEEGYSPGWKSKEYLSPEGIGAPDPSEKISSANIYNTQIVVDKLSIGAHSNINGISNIMIGNEPYIKRPYWADDYLPGLHWNSGSSTGNISIGDKSLRSAQNVQSNIAIGNDSLYELRNGWGNTAIGVEAGNYLKSGTNNVFIGYGAGPQGGGGNEDVQGQVVLGGDSAQELWVGGNRIFPFPEGSTDGIWKEVDGVATYDGDSVVLESSDENKSSALTVKNKLVETTLTHENDAGGNTLGAVGTTTKDGFRIITNGEQRIRVNRSGLVDIGGVQPDSRIATFADTGHIQFYRLPDASKDSITSEPATPNLYIDDTRIA